MESKCVFASRWILEEENVEPFTADEKMDIAIDLMYFSAKGEERESKCQSDLFFPGTFHIMAGGRPAGLSPAYVWDRMDIR